MRRKSLQSVIVITLVIFFSLGCNLLNGPLQTQGMGTIKIVNTHVRGSDPFPGGMNLPDAREYGVCIITYPAAAGFTPPTNDMILAKDGEETNYQLPAGTYILQEWQFDSEINQDPLYSPAMKTFVRPPETVVLGVDQIIVFGSERTLPAPGDFVEGNPINPNCVGAPLGSGVFATDTPEADTGGSEVSTGVWVLKLVQPDQGKIEAQFSFSGLACSGGAKATSTESNATITTTGGCQTTGALVANEITQHSWTRPPDRLTPGQEVTGVMTASSSGLCNWTVLTTEAGCRSSVKTWHIVWQGDGGQTDFSGQNLVFQNDSANQANASTNPTGSFKWTVPDGSHGGKTLLLQFVSHSYEGEVTTNLWYEWQGP